MSSPKDPVVRRDYPGGPLIPVGETVDAEVPAGRLDEAGADGDLIAYLQMAADAADDRDRFVGVLDLASDVDLAVLVGNLDDTMRARPDLEQVAAHGPATLTSVDDVLDRPVPDVVRWAGPPGRPGTSARARAIREAEERRPSPRTTLLRAIRELAGG